MSASDEMIVFTRVISKGSFAAAAVELGLTPSAISKTITRTEDRLGIRLLNRTTRRLELTEEGQEYLASAQEILSRIEDLEARVSLTSKKPTGKLRVSVSTAMGRHQLASAIPKFMELYPEITIELQASDRQVDLIKEQVDIAVRMGAMSDSSLITRKLADMHRIICASPQYLKRVGTPQKPTDLHKHECMTVAHHTELSHWPFKTPDGINKFAIKSSLSCDNADILREMALEGAGIVRLGHFIVLKDIEEGNLIPLFTETHHSEIIPVMAVTVPGRHRTRRVKVFLDFLTDLFQDIKIQARR